MKRPLLTLWIMLLLALPFAAHSQLPAASLAPNFILKDLDGRTHNLYDYLDQGKTVFIDVSAAWCGPCWDYHTTHAFSDLYRSHGPAGMSGVNANTTDDVMVFLIEGEGFNTRAQLYGTSGTGSLYSMGDWVTGTPYPILDTNAVTTNSFKNAWRINSFPTIYMVCRDRLVYPIGRQTATDLYAASRRTCPSYAPSGATDAKAMSYTGDHYFFCNGKPPLRFQNYSTTDPITRATIKVYDGANNLASTYNWTGSVAPMGIATVNIPAFPSTQLQGYRFEVEVPGDLQPANNKSADSLFKVYGNSGQSLPYSEDFEGPVSPLLTFPITPGLIIASPGTLNDIMISSSGARGKGVVFNFWVQGAGSVKELIVGNINTASVTNNATFEFDLAYCQNDQSKDSLEVYISNNCGGTWTRAWGKSGAALATKPIQARMYTPSAANQWRHESFPLRNHKGTNMLVKFRGTALLGNNAWIDNLEIKDAPTAVPATRLMSGLGVWPNPAREIATVSLPAQLAGVITLFVTDLTGRVVYNTQQLITGGEKQEIIIPTDGFTDGLYVVNVQTENGERQQRKLQVLK